MSTTTKVSASLACTLGAMVALCSLFVLPYCHTQQPMHCYYMVHTAAGIGAAIFVIGIAMLFLGVTAARRLALVGSFLGFAIVAEAGWMIGPCANPMMPCHSFTQPVLLLAGVLIAAAGLIDWWRLSRLPRE